MNHHPTPTPVQAFADFVDLAAARIGGAVVYANDEFFAEKENLVKDSEPVYDPDRYTERGKWMDGWESRRRRDPGHDWCIVRLGLSGELSGVVVDTRHFLGNYPAEFALEGIDLQGSPEPDWSKADALPWTGLIPRTPLDGGTLNPVAVPEPSPVVSHLRFAIYPDGGVARFRAFGQVRPPEPPPGGSIDLAALENGGRVVGVSDDFFGRRHNLLLPGPARGMFDGWETRRRRGEGNDWAVVRLGRAGTLYQAEIDTSWFRGNAPGACSLEATRSDGWDDDSDWTSLLDRVPLRPDARHRFELRPETGSWRHVRLQIFPDGGVARLRLWGTP